MGCLGLAIASNLAELHGGKVSVASDGLGKGAEFTLFLPLTNSHTAGSVFPDNITSFSNGKSLSKPDSITLKDIRVLIVEDDPDAAEMLRHALRGVGAQTRNAFSVAEAIGTLGEWVPNVVLSDITMPDEDGYALIKQIRGMQTLELANVPAIALTAMARSEDGDRAISSGFHLHIPKPVDIDELTKAIAGLLYPQ